MAIHIYTAGQLDAIRHNTYGEDDRYIGGDYVQMNDIDCSDFGPMYSIGMNPGGRSPEGTPMWWHDNIFTGSYDGNGFKIKNWHNVVTTANVWAGSNFPIWGLGLFARVNGTIQNVTMENCNLIGLSSEMHSSPWGIGYFPIDWSCGALIGHLHGGTVYNCSSSGVIRTPEGLWNYLYYKWSWGQANGGIGGLIGWARGDMDNVLVEQCFSECNLLVEYQFVDVYKPAGIGGLIGKTLWGLGHGGHTDNDSRPTELHDVTLKNVYAMGNVNSFIQGGGVGGLSGTAQHAGGKNAYIEHGYSKGSISTPSTIFGGQGSGFVGRVWDSTGVTENCYYDIQTSGRSDTEGGVYPRTTSEMTFPSSKNNTYVDWDFHEVWAIDPEVNLGYPFFGEGLIGIHVKKNGKWRAASGMWTKKRGKWRPVQKVYPKKKGKYRNTASGSASQEHLASVETLELLYSNQLKCTPAKQTAIDTTLSETDAQKVMTIPDNI